MIYEVLNYLKIKLESFLTDGRAAAEPIISLSNPWSNNNNNNNGASFLNSISLINIEEEKIFKAQLQHITQKKNGSYTTREPDLKLNLYLLVSAYNKNYEDALKFISRVVTYFQSNNVFIKNNGAADGLPEGVEQIIIELYTAAFEQQNQIWASLSTGYLPSVIYKVRMITIDAGKESERLKSITGVVLKADNSLNVPVKTDGRLLHEKISK